ncbi:MAG: transglutaminase family protein [Dehalococcoidia bacterium]
MIDPVQHEYLDTKGLDWSRLRSATFEVLYGLRYEYPGPIDDVRQMLMLVPADHLGTQTLIEYSVRSEPSGRPRFSHDRFGNRICHIALPRVEGPLEFRVALQVQQVEQRDGGGMPLRDADEPATFMGPSPLTEPTPELAAVAAELTGQAAEPAALAETINHWVHEHMTYAPGATAVFTTAQDAYLQQRGVCQDYAHLMIALCRLAGLPARYISGHLLGEGVMHAWTQVLLPSGAGQSWQAFDPLHDRRAGMPYVTIAVGRDYGDVSPTRGSFRAPYSGHLARSFKRSGAIAIERE